MKYATIAIILSFAISSKVAAGNNIILKGGTLYPKGSITVMTPDLEKPNAIYNVQCSIISTSFTAPDQPVIVINPHGTVNERPSSSGQYLIGQQINKYELKGVSAHRGSKKLTVTFENYDNSITLYISDCFATFATQ